jgi:hypothetical protein
MGAGCAEETPWFALYLLSSKTPPEKRGTDQPGNKYKARPKGNPSPIQTLTVGPGISPGQPVIADNSALRVAGLACADLTAGREFHPAPKV